MGCDRLEVHRIAESLLGDQLYTSAKGSLALIQHLSTRCIGMPVLLSTSVKSEYLSSCFSCAISYCLVLPLSNQTPLGRSFLTRAQTVSKSHSDDGSKMALEPFSNI